MRFLVLVGAICLALLVPTLHGGDDAHAKKRLQTVTRTDTVAQSGDGPLPAQDAAISGEPFTFGKAGKLRRLQRLTITATLDDAETGPGESDENLLHLALDGIDTGIVLNGFRENEVDTRTISGVPDNKARILAELKADGQLAATIVRPAGPTGNQVVVPADFDTTLVLKGKQKRKR
jgi:hypothetical protein